MHHRSPDKPRVSLALLAAEHQVVQGPETTEHRNVHWAHVTNPSRAGHWGRLRQLVWGKHLLVFTEV